MSSDGPAQLSGKIQVNDLLMMVNGKEVFGLPVTVVTPLLVGTFGSKVTLKFRRAVDDKPVINKVILFRGKKATFTDASKGKDPQEGSKRRKVTVAVPEGMKPGDILQYEDEDCEVTKVGFLIVTCSRVSFGLF